MKILAKPCFYFSNPMVQSWINRVFLVHQSVSQLLSSSARTPTGKPIVCPNAIFARRFRRFSVTEYNDCLYDDCLENSNQLPAWLYPFWWWRYFSVWFQLLYPICFTLYYSAFIYNCPIKIQPLFWAHFEHYFEPFMRPILSHILSPILISFWALFLALFELFLSPYFEHFF